jgi:hypothetical protein
LPDHSALQQLQLKFIIDRPVFLIWVENSIASLKIDKNWQYVIVCLLICLVFICLIVIKCGGEKAAVFVIVYLGTQYLLDSPHYAHGWH